MASLWDKLTGRSQLQNVSQQVSVMQANMDNLSLQNSILQQQLAVQFRKEGAFMRADYNNQISYIRDGYNISSAVYAIVSDIAARAAGIPKRVYIVKDDKALKSYKHYKSLEQTPENYCRAMDLHKKALEEVPDDNPLQRLVDQPNQDDDTQTFWQMVTGFRLLTGNSYLYAPSLDMGADKGKVTELRIMPSPYVILYVTNTFPQKVVGYQLIIDGVRLLDTPEVLHMKYPNYDWTIDGQQLYGMSPLKAATRTLKRSNYSETAALALLENGGPSVIIANKSISSDDMGNTQIGKSKQEFKQEYSGPKNKGKYKMMAGDISAIPLGIDAVDMDLINGENWSFDMLCNVFKISSVMFNNHDGNTESNVKEMRKDSWTRAILPETKAICDMLNRRVVPTYNKGNVKYFIDADISGIPELQPDMVALTTWLNNSWWVTPNQRLEMQKFEKSVDPNMDKVWMPNNLVTMDDASINVGEYEDPNNKPSNDDNTGRDNNDASLLDDENDQEL